jgi:hypothetical protein
VVGKADDKWKTGIRTDKSEGKQEHQHVSDKRKNAWKINAV